MGPVNRRHRTHFYLSAEKPPNYSDRIIKFSYFADTTIIHIFDCTKIIAYEYSPPNSTHHTSDGGNMLRPAFLHPRRRLERMERTAEQDRAAFPGESEAESSGDDMCV